MPKTPLMVAAILISELVPRGVETLGELEVVREFPPSEYDLLSQGERAAYEIARDLWLGDGYLTRFLIYADERYANVLLSALTVALGPVLIPLP
jgi:hypothetical protein